MIISRLVLNPRHRETYRLLADIYAQHRFVMSAFPDRAETESRTDGARSERNILYRVDTTAAGQIDVLVQSGETPDWIKTTVHHPGVICTNELREDKRAFNGGERYRFRLRANPTVCRVNRGADGRRNPKRECLFKEAEQLDWLARAAERSGFSVNTDAVLIAPRGKREGKKPSSNTVAKAHCVTSYAVDFDGILIITDADLFVKALRAGVGRGKAWGCGLLSVIRSSR